MPHSSVVLDDLSFSWPDGQIALNHLSAAFSSGRTGLVGRNGSGKSTLLRLIDGTLSPTSGNVSVSGSVATLAQTLVLGRVTNPAIRCVGVALNTVRFGAEEAQAEMAAVAQRLGLPVADAIRGGAAFEQLLDACTP